MYHKYSTIYMIFYHSSDVPISSPTESLSFVQKHCNILLNFLKLVKNTVSANGSILQISPDTNIIFSLKFLELPKSFIMVRITISKRRWLFKFLKVDSIHLNSRSLSAVIYPNVVGAQNHQTILSCRIFCRK